MTKPDIIRVLSFDPGTEMGYGLELYDTKTGKIVVEKYGTLHGYKLIKDRKELLKEFPKSYVVLDAYFDKVCEMLVEHDPHEVVVEGAFVARFPQAYASLILVINTIRRACHAVLHRDIRIIAPREAKLTITTKGGADKDQMKEAILHHTSIEIKDHKDDPILECPSHVFDAIGLGCTFIIKFLPTLLADPSYHPTGQYIGEVA